MVRRRMASPRPSAPSRSFSRPQANSRSSYASPPPSRTTAQPAPSAATPAATTMPPSGGLGMGSAAPRGPSLMGQMAATAGGVAIGSAVGHAVGNMMTGGSGGRSEEVAAAPTASAANATDGQPLSNPCEFEWKQFVECSQTQSDISLCQSLNEAFKQCRARYN
uniref:CHCH domain-containing protein n=1 Tax=Syphacia muris TaxID=451379 RepID=A0A0N5AS67_9BILA